MSRWMAGTSDGLAVRNVTAAFTMLFPPRPSAIARSSRAHASSTSASVMTNGGSSRTTVSDVRLTSSPSSSAASTTGSAGRSSSRPQIRPAPRTSRTIGWRAAIARSPRSRCAPTDATCEMRSRSIELLEKHERRAARQQVAAVGAAVVAKGRRLRHPLAEERGGDRHARAERLADGHQVRLEPERLRVERTAGPSEPALDLVGDEERARPAARLGRPRPPCAG